LVINRAGDLVSETDKSGQDDGTSSEKQSDPADTSKEISSDQSKPDPNQTWKEEWTSEGFVYYWNTETAGRHLVYFQPVL